MKKKISFLLATVFVFSALIFCVSADTNETPEEYIAYQGALYLKEELIVASAEFFNPEDFVGEGPFDFMGLSIMSLEIIVPSKQLNGETEVYLIKLAPDVDTLGAFESIKKNESVIEVLLNSVVYPDEDWGQEQNSPEGSPFIGMGEAELKEHWRFAPDEITLCLEEEIDLDEFKGDGPHYLYEVSIGKINRVESEDSFVYNVKLGQQDMRNCDALAVFESNENVKWVEYTSYYGNGDVNRDGAENSIDYLLVKRMCLNTYMPNNLELGYADVNFDSEVNSIDYLLVKRNILGTNNK